MKLVLAAIAFAAIAGAQTPPECTYTLAHSRPGALAIFRNGVLLDPAAYNRTGLLGRTITLLSWNDQDKITYSYPFAANTTIPGTSPPATILIWIPTLEYHTCTGVFPPPVAALEWWQWDPDFQAYGWIGPLTADGVLNAPELPAGCHLQTWQVRDSSTDQVSTRLYTFSCEVSLRRGLDANGDGCWAPGDQIIDSCVGGDSFPWVLSKF